MESGTLIVLVVVIPIATSVTTLLVAKLAFDRWKDEVLEDLKEQALTELRERALPELIATAGPEIERRVRAGAVAAGEELMPTARANVRAAFDEILLSVTSGRAAEAPLRDFAESSRRAFEEGFEALLGGRSPRSKKD